MCARWALKRSLSPALKAVRLRASPSITAVRWLPQHSFCFFFQLQLGSPMFLSRSLFNVGKKKHQWHPLLSKNIRGQIKGKRYKQEKRLINRRRLMWSRKPTAQLQKKNHLDTKTFYDLMTIRGSHKLQNCQGIKKDNLSARHRDWLQNRVEVNNLCLSFLLKYNENKFATLILKAKQQRSQDHENEQTHTHAHNVSHDTSLRS